MNLVEQQNMLRELSDGQLSQAMNSGVAPQYLVVAEAKRREDARKRYVTLKQKYDATVAETVMQGLGPSAQGMLGGGQPMAAPGGLDAALPGAPMDAAPAPEMPMGIEAAMPPGPPAFAKGGPVHRYRTGNMVSSMFAPEPADDLIKFRMAAAGMAGLPPALPAEAAPIAPPTAAAASMTPLSFNYPEFNDPYAELRDLYASQVDELDAERERAGALALISAGLGIAGGKSQNFARNLAGAQDAIKGYGEQMGDIEARRQALMQGQMSTQAMSRQALSEMKKNFQDSPEGRRQMVEQLGADPADPAVQYYIASGQGADRAFGIANKSDFDKPVWGMSGGKEVQGRYNYITSQYEDANGNPLPDFSPLTEADLLARNERAKRDVKFEPTKFAYDNDAFALSSAMTEQKYVENLAENILAELPKAEVTGPFAWLSATGSGPQANIRAMLEQLQSHATLQTLRDLRAGSKDGSSGLGQITQKELELLNKKLANLTQMQDKAKLAQNITELVTKFRDMNRRLKAKFDEIYGSADFRSPEYETELGLDDVMPEAGPVANSSAASTDDGMSLFKKLRVTQAQ